MREGGRAVLIFSVVLVVHLIAGHTFAWPVPDTGQTKCYNTSGEIPCPPPGGEFYGQDGSYLLNPPSFAKLDEQGHDLPEEASSWAMIRDNVTGLLWEVKTATVGDDPLSWRDAWDYVDGLTLGGYGDWRLPTAGELHSIVNYGISHPALFEEYFMHIQPFCYWTSTTVAAGVSPAWSLCFERGELKPADEWEVCRTIAVRSDSLVPFYDLVDNGDGTVTDAAGGLMWQQTSMEPADWMNALSISEELYLAGFDDWRLPTIKEIQSIIDYETSNPATFLYVFPDTAASGYWSSTTDSGKPGDAWNADFGTGSIQTAGKDEKLYIRAVRGGRSSHLKSIAAADMMASSESLVVETPSPGSSWEVGDIMNITWRPYDSGGTVRIEISRDGGSTYGTIASSIPDEGSYSWTVTGPDSVNCMLKITTNLGRASSGLFTIYSYGINVEASCFIGTAGRDFPRKKH